MDLYNSIIVAIWLCVAYAIWAATAAGDPGYGQVAFLFGGIFAHLYLRKIKLERPISKNDEIRMPDADFSVEIPDEGDKFYFSEKSYRKIIWISTIISLILVSIFIETITYQPEYLIWGVVAFIFGLIVFIIPIFLPIKDDIETLRKRAEKERIKAWRRGKFGKDDYSSKNNGKNEEEDDLKKTKLSEEEE